MLVVKTGIEVLRQESKVAGATLAPVDFDFCLSTSTHFWTTSTRRDIFIYVSDNTAVAPQLETGPGP